MAVPSVDVPSIALMPECRSRITLGYVRSMHQDAPHVATVPLFPHSGGVLYFKTSLETFAPPRSSLMLRVFCACVDGGKGVNCLRV